MVDIKQGVGDQCANTSEETALVQLMLRVVKNAQGQPYYASDYNGKFDVALKAAITAFQKDYKLIDVKQAAPEAQKAPLKAAQPFAEKEGVLAPNSKSLDALVAKLPPDYKDIRIIPGTKTIYVPGNGAKAALTAAAIRNQKELNPDFREKVAQLVETVFKEHKIVLGIPSDGWRRDFQGQAAVNPAATGAGPGESAHQFGRSVDIGFQSLKWVNGDATFKTEDFWLNKNGLPQTKKEEFWSARNAIAYKQLGLHKTNKPGDLIHVQSFDDAKLSWGKSLAKLLETVSPNKAKWSVAPGSPNNYKVDPGLGGTVTAGSAYDIWTGNAAINKAELVKALNAKLAVDPNFPVEKILGSPIKMAPPGPDLKGVKTPAAKPVALKEDDIKADQVKYLQKMLKTEMQAADKNWDQWSPIK